MWNKFYRIWVEIQVQLLRYIATNFVCVLTRLSRSDITLLDESVLSGNSQSGTSFTNPRSQDFQHAGVFLDMISKLQKSEVSFTECVFRKIGLKFKSNLFGSTPPILLTRMPRSDSTLFDERSLYGDSEIGNSFTRYRSQDFQYVGGLLDIISKKWWMNFTEYVFDEFWAEFKSNLTGRPPPNLYVFWPESLGRTLLWQTKDRFPKPVIHLPFTGLRTFSMRETSWMIDAYGKSVSVFGAGNPVQSDRSSLTNFVCM